MKTIKGMVSVIIPIYQTKIYLTSCVKSILNQRYKNIEIILVDDGSDDGSSELCEEYAQKYDNIFCIHQSNNGVSSARNLGIDNAKGEYILFVDSDDYIAMDYLEDAIVAIKNEDADMYLCGFQNVRKDGNVKENKFFPLIRDGIWQYDIGSIIMQLFYSNTLHAIGTKIYKKDIIERFKIRFKKKWRYYEDIYFCLSYLNYCNTIYVQNKIMYYYRKDSHNSLSKQKNSLRYENIYDTFFLLYRIMKSEKNNDKNEKHFYELYLRQINAYINLKILTEMHYNVYIHRFYKMLSKDIFYNKALKSEGKLQKLQYFFISKGFYFGLYIIQKCKKN